MDEKPSTLAKTLSLTNKDLYPTLSLTNKDLHPSIYVCNPLDHMMPSTSSTAERSFSAMNRIKRYLRSTMGNGRLSSLDSPASCSP